MVNSMIYCTAWTQSQQPSTAVKSAYSKFLAYIMYRIILIVITSILKVCFDNYIELLNVSMYVFNN